MNPIFYSIGLLYNIHLNYEGEPFNVASGFDIRFLINNTIVGAVVMGGLMCSFILLFKRKHFGSPNFYLGLLIFGVTMTLLEILLFWTPYFNYHPFVFLYQTLFFIWGPSYYLYLFYTVKKKHSKRGFLHYLSFFLVLLGVFFIENSLFSSTKGGQLFLIAVNSFSLKVVHILYYVISGSVLIHGSKLQMEGKQLQSILWLDRFMKIIALILTVRLFSNISGLNQLLIYSTVVLLFLFILVISIAILSKQRVLSFFFLKQQMEDKYKYSPLTSDMVQVIRNDLLKLLKEDKIYLENTISLDKISELLDIDRYAVSQVINQGFNKNFYELINDYRIDHAITILKENSELKKSNQKIKVIDLVYDCGFNNKVSFYKAFKKRKGMTPKEYRDTILNKEEVFFDTSDQCSI